MGNRYTVTQTGILDQDYVDIYTQIEEFLNQSRNGLEANGGLAKLFKKFSCSILKQLKSSYLRLRDTVKQKDAIIRWNKLRWTKTSNFSLRVI